MKVPFIKMQGCGNDFIFFDARKLPTFEWAKISGRLLDRRFGIGGDTMLVLLSPKEKGSDGRMLTIERDGNESEMCGNGIRCVARYLQETGVPKSTYAFETPGGRRTVEIESFERIRVDMGAPIFEPGKIPVASEAPIWGKEIDVEGQNVKIYTLSMGNPHAVIFVGRSEQLNQVTTLGPKVERHSLFPRRTNVEFVHIKDGHLHVRVWERSAGETWACGTGASAAGVVALREKHVKNPVRVEFRGGTVEISWKDGESVFMTGPAGRVFEGEVDL